MAKNVQKCKKWPKIGPKMAKNQNFKNLLQTFFLTIFYSNLAKFQVPRAIFAHSIKESVISRYRNFKLRDPFFMKIGLILLDISRNGVCTRYFGGWNNTNHGDTWKTIKKSVLKPFLGPQNRYSDYFMLSHFILKKSWFLPYPAVLKREYLELGIEFWHSVKSVDLVFFHMNSTCFFYPGPPLPH